MGQGLDALKLSHGAAVAQWSLGVTSAVTVHHRGELSERPAHLQSKCEVWQRNIRPSEGTGGEARSLVTFTLKSSEEVKLCSFLQELHSRDAAVCEAAGQK